MCLRNQTNPLTHGDGPFVLTKTETINTNGPSPCDIVWEQGRRLSSITKHLSSGVRTYSYAYDMSGVRSSKSIEITVDGILRHRRYDYVTQNGKVVRETAYYTDGDGEFMHCMDFFYDENGNPFAMRKYSDETLSSYNTYYYVLNAQGDVVKLIAPSGNVYAEYSYDAWGEYFGFIRKPSQHESAPVQRILLR